MPRRVSTVPKMSVLIAALGGDLRAWSHNCHAASVKLVKSGVLGPSRVARGFCRGVPGQHSWVVLGMDCYDPEATIVDPTLWSYDSKVKGILVTRNRLRHTPHGVGSIWEAGRPPYPTGGTIKLTPKTPLSEDARAFLKLLGPLDRTGWNALASLAPVEGWPAGEIYAAMDDTKGLSVLIPVDRLGMLTDRMPDLYLP